MKELNYVAELDYRNFYYFSAMPELDNYPELQQLGNLDLLARQVVEGFITGLHKSPFHGFSVEFAEHRSYNTGEGIKNIDWKLFARTDKLFVKQFEEETNLRCQLVIDHSSSMHYPNKGISKLKFSVYCAAALIYLLQKQRDAFGLSVFAEKLEIQTPAKSTVAHQKFLFSELDKLLVIPKIAKKTAIASVLHQLSDSIHKRSLVILFSDCMEKGLSEASAEEFFSALRHLKHNKHEIIIFNVSDHTSEVHFNFDNRPHLFVDVETGEELRIHPNEIKNSYLKQIDTFRTNLHLKCGQYGIDLVDADINQGFHHLLHTYLIKRNRMI